MLWVISDPGCLIQGQRERMVDRHVELTTTQFRILISASVIPSDPLTKARLVRTWPINETYTVTKDISMVLANSAVTRLAVDGSIPLPVEIFRPQRGCMTATMNQTQLSDVE
jgi:hypothetical protein